MWAWLGRYPRLRLAVVSIAGVVLVGIPWWAPPALSTLAFFRIRKVEVVGLQYLAASDVLSRLGVDTTVSLWTDLAPLESLVALHPQVQSVAMRRRLPGTLVVEIHENLPVALVPAAAGFRVMDIRGDTLPIDPARTHVDLPILARRDTTLLKLLAGVRDRTPGLFARVSELRRSGDELELTLAGVTVRTMADLSPARLADILPVEQDLLTRGRVASELDLRFGEQVIARLQ